MVKAELNIQVNAVPHGNVWWTGMDKELEALVKSRVEYAEVKEAHNFSLGSRTWQRIRPFVTSHSS